MQQVFIVMIETQSEGSWHWDVHRVFATMQAAKDYISKQKRGYYKDCDFDIQTEEVYS